MSETTAARTDVILGRQRHVPAEAEKSKAFTFPLTLEAPIESPPLPLLAGECIKAELKLSSAVSGTMVIGPGAEKRDDPKRDWTDEFVQALKKDPNFLSLDNPEVFQDDFQRDALDSDGLQTVGVPGGPAGKVSVGSDIVFKINWKVSGTLRRSGIKLSAEAVLISLKQKKDGKVDVTVAALEFKGKKNKIYIKSLKIAEHVEGKDIGIIVTTTLSIKPDWLAIGEWLGFEGFLTLAFFVLAAAPFYEYYRTATSIIEWHNAKRRVPSDAEQFAQGYMDGLDINMAKNTGDAQASSLYIKGWEQGRERANQAYEDFKAAYPPRAGYRGPTPTDLWLTWLEKHRSEIESQIKVESLKQAKRAAWVAYNEEHSHSIMDQRGFWLWVFDKDPVKAGELELFQRYANKTSDAFYSGRW